jgi:shikimate 5-dehydrogenase
MEEASHDYAVYGILGGPSVAGIPSSTLHNAVFAELGLPAVYIPFPCDSLEPSFLADLPRCPGIVRDRALQGNDPAVPAEKSPDVSSIAPATRHPNPAGWSVNEHGSPGFREKRLNLLDAADLRGLRATILGAGCSARAAAYALRKQGGAVCVISRIMNKANAGRAPRLRMVRRQRTGGGASRSHNDLIIQATRWGRRTASRGIPGMVQNFPARKP